MSLIRTFHLKTSLLLGSLLGLGFGCVINLEPLEECEEGSNNKLDDDGDCVCRAFYEPCDAANFDNPDHPQYHECCEEQNADEVGDGDGDTTTTGDGDGDTAETTDDTTETGDGDGDNETELPPETCSPDEEGAVWCTHTEADGPEGSRFFVCQGGVWVDDSASMDGACEFDGYDFAYGCVDDGTNVVFECGVGSGDPCENEAEPFCADMDNYAYCLYGKETWDSCMTFCQEVGVDGVTYEYGECDDSLPEVACYCCDAGTEGCPI